VSLPISDTARMILSGLHKKLTSDLSITSHSLQITEASRIAGLTYVLSSIARENPYTFSHLSFKAEQSGVSQNETVKLAQEALESFRYPMPKTMSLAERVTLLGLIHSLGCYSLPLEYNEGTSQRPLGAYYTPPAVADYIVSLTLSPVLKRLAVKATNNAIESLQEILSLRTLDPACGTGVFLISAMNAYIRAMKEGIQNALSSGTSKTELRKLGLFDFKEKIRHNMFGVDIDSGSLEVTDISLRLLVNDENLGESGLSDSLKQGNSLISLLGMNGTSDHRDFFSNTDSRFPFEWSIEFNRILENGGFDFIVMNPPYDRLKPNFAEFLREQLSTGEREIHEESFLKYKKKLNEDVSYFRNSGEYQLGNRYTIDTHRLFIERSLQLSKEGGRIGFIVPSTILGDLSSYQLRRVLIQENNLQSVDEFPETSKLFDGVTQSFSVISLERGGKTDSISARFDLRNIEDTKLKNYFQIEANSIEKNVGSSLSVPQVNKTGWRLLSKLHTHPSISSLTWLSVRRGELDLTLDKGCIISKGSDIRLIRGSNINRFTLNIQSEPVAEFVDIESLRKKMGSSSRVAHIEQYRIAGQQISNRTQRWRLKFALVSPKVVLANSCNYLVENDHSDKSRRLFLLGVLNSELLNWRFGVTNTNNHVSIRELNQLPIAVPDSSRTDRIYSLLVDEVKQLKSGKSSPMIEALVFTLYGFSSNDVKSILKMRQTPEMEKKAILHDFDTL
jgi:adenine-specific DNA-methyltransferase